MLVITGDGWLHKAVDVGSRLQLIEGVQLFPTGQPVQNLLLDAQRVSELDQPCSRTGAPQTARPEP